MSNEEFDKYDMRRVILEYPNQLELGRSFVKNVDVQKKDFSNLIICGMGGSALPADLLSEYFKNKKTPFALPIYISRTYDLPNVTSSKSLVFISSYSGNTEETLSCFKKALKLETTIVSFSAGGKVEEIATKERIPHVSYKIDFEGFQPRYATTYAFMAMNEVLTKLGLSDTMEKLPNFDSRSLEVRGEEIAQQIKGKIPVIYAPEELKILAKMWKIKINENAKTPAFWNYFPELNHNEMNGFVSPQGEFHIIIFKDTDSHPQINRRIEITAKLYRDHGLKVTIIDTIGTNYLEKLIWGMILGDWVSYYLAYEYKQDPTPVKMVEKLKKMLQ